MNTHAVTGFRDYLSLILLFVPAVAFAVLLLIFRGDPRLTEGITLFHIPWEFYLIGLFGLIATIGGVLDWRFHRDPLNMKIPPKEREAEALALGLGGVPMFVLMWLAMMSDNPVLYLVPITIVLIYTVVAISYDEFVFHRKRCGKRETIYHRMLVLGNGAAFLSWMFYIYY